MLLLYLKKFITILVSSFNLLQSFNYTPYLFYKNGSNQRSILSACIWTLIRTSEIKFLFFKPFLRYTLVQCFSIIETRTLRTVPCTTVYSLHLHTSESFESSLYITIVHKLHDRGNAQKEKKFKTMPRAFGAKKYKTMDILFWTFFSLQCN